MRRRPLQEVTMSQTSPDGLLFKGITIGTVVATDDPQEQGRVRVACKALGDLSLSSPNFNELDIPWCRPLEEFGGAATVFSSGPDGDITTGTMGHGSVHQIEKYSTAIVACIDGDTNYRVVLGVISPQLIKNTLPSGRYSIDSSGTKLDGPFTENDTPVQPLYNNLETAYDKESFEWLSRGADFMAAALSSNIAKSFIESAADNKEITLTLPDGSTLDIRQGYSSKGKGTVYSKTTPGFHSMSMDDRAENCRIRFRTTSGRQVLLDDTNERIYVSTPKNRNWVELDDNGNIDMFSNTRVSIYGANDINLSSSGNVRLYGKEGIHLLSDNEIRTHSESYNVRSSTVEWNVDNSYNLTVGTDFNLSSGNITASVDEGFQVSAGQGITLYAETQLLATTPGIMSLVGNTSATLSSSTKIDVFSPLINIGGGLIHANSSSSPAVPGIESQSVTAQEANALFAFSSNRVPFNINAEGLMWSRASLSPSVTDNDTSSNSNNFLHYENMEFEYNDPRSNVVDLGLSYDRNKHWKR